MDISAEQSKPDIKRPGLFSAAIQSVLGIASRLIGFLHLTEEEQHKAGIYLGGEGRDG